MSEDEIKISESAKEFVKQNKQKIIGKFTNPTIYKPVSTPISLFMAGSPGAGKTEVSKSLVKRFNDIPIRIDADEIRKECPGYIGSNAHLFQEAANKGVNILLDHSFSDNLNFILDGTFAHADPFKNIQRSLDHKRLVELWFIYQKPELAWESTKARESSESRRVSKEVFIKAFLGSKSNTIEAKKHFSKALELNLLIKNIDKTDGEFKLNIQANELDRYLNDGYTENKLNELIK